MRALTLACVLLAGCGGPPVPPASASARAHVSVTLYTTRWCPHCAHARDWLRARGIPYHDMDVETDPVAAAQPTSGGNAPASPPMTMFCGVRRFSQTV